MSSSISNSDPWAGFLRHLMSAVILLAGLPFVLLVLLDPYDTGRLTPFPGGIGKASPRKAAASRGRDSAFDSAIIGNSTTQLLMPERLSHLTGGRFVSLTLPGSGPAEQLTVLSWFARHHAAPHTVIVGIDDLWCEGSLRRDSIKHPFPFWLFDSTASYLAGLYTTESLEQAGRKLRRWVGGAAPRPDGYDDYDAGNAPPEAPLPAVPADGTVDASLDSAARTRLDETFGALAAALDALPASTNTILLFPPRHISHVPAEGKAGWTALAACKAAALAVVAGRNHARLLDLLLPGPLSEPSGYRDPIHYRGWIARKIEDDVARTLESKRP